jgi:hypothetical protein
MNLELPGIGSATRQGDFLGSPSPVSAPVPWQEVGMKDGKFKDIWGGKGFSYVAGGEKLSYAYQVHLSPLVVLGRMLNQ